MFAVITLGGKQYKVHEKDEFNVEKLDSEEGKNIKVSEVLLVSDEEGKNVKIGTPFVTGAQVECKIMEHGKGEKIRVVKFKPKKRYSKVQGHRQLFTRLKVLKISSVERKAAVPKPAPMKIVEKSKES